MATWQLTAATDGTCLQRLIETNYDANGNEVTTVLSDWVKCDHRTGHNISDPTEGYDVVSTSRSNLDVRVDDVPEITIAKPTGKMPGKLTPPSPKRVDMTTIITTSKQNEEYTYGDSDQRSSGSGCGCSDSSEECTCKRKKIVKAVVTALAVTALLAGGYLVVKYLGK